MEVLPPRQTDTSVHSRLTPAVVLVGRLQRLEPVEDDLEVRPQPGLELDVDAPRPGAHPEDDGAALVRAGAVDRLEADLGRLGRAARVGPQALLALRWKGSRGH